MNFFYILGKSSKFCKIISWCGRTYGKDETVWLNREQTAILFDRDIKKIGKHINNALREELDNSTVTKFATVQKEGSREITRDIEYYNLDMIISVGNLRFKF